MQLRNQTKCEALVDSLVEDLEEKSRLYRRSDIPLDKELLDLFVVQLDENLSKMKAACNPFISETFKEEAHSIRGMGGLLGCPELSVLASEIESLAVDGDKARCLILFDGLQKWQTLFLQGLKSA